MMLISVTRLHLRSLFKVPLFLWFTFRAYFQSKRAKGLQQISFFNENIVTYWTLTAWESLEAMLDYRNNGSHLQAIKNAKLLADELQACHWEGDSFPDWQDAKQHLYKTYPKS